jgi:hypothetical protein
VVIVPAVGIVPLQPPEAVQVSALDAFHCNVTDAPMATLLSFACRLTVGAVATATGLAAAVVPVKASDDDCPLQAASALRAVMQRIDLMTNTAQTRRLPQFKFIPRLPRGRVKFFRGADFIHQQSLRSHIHSIFGNCQPVAICKLDMFSDAISSWGI